MSEDRKKEIAERMKSMFEKTYVLTFNKEESLFIEGDKLDAMSGATDSWGKNFAAGDQYKNVKDIKFKPGRIPRIFFCFYRSHGYKICLDFKNMKVFDYSIKKHRTFMLIKRNAEIII